jgi:hypothetical protein
MTSQRLTLKAVKAELANHNISIHKIDGEYKVYPKGTIGQAYFTDSLADALGTGVLMAIPVTHLKQAAALATVPVAAVRPLFVVSSVDGHLFACKYSGDKVTLTNEYGCATELSVARAACILGVRF